jgi:uncharacterized protein (DUF1810 family)
MAFDLIRRAGGAAARPSLVTPGLAITRLPGSSSRRGTSRDLPGGVAPRRTDMPAGAAFDLERFVTAQAPVFATALAELQSGQKRGHWMWFIFPQLRGLGHSAMARHYGIGSLAEARAYLAHPLLGPRLVQCTRAALAIEGRSLHVIFGSPDDVKFRSSMTLFALAASEEDSVFRQALDRFCGGRADERTLALLGPQAGQLRTS